MEHLVYYDIAAAFVLLTALAAYHLRKYSDNFQSISTLFSTGSC